MNPPWENWSVSSCGNVTGQLQEPNDLTRPATVNLLNTNTSVATHLTLPYGFPHIWPSEPGGCIGPKEPLAEWLRLSPHGLAMHYRGSYPQPTTLRCPGTAPSESPSKEYGLPTSCRNFSIPWPIIANYPLYLSIAFKINQNKVSNLLLVKHQNLQRLLLNWKCFIKTRFNHCYSCIASGAAPPYLHFFIFWKIYCLNKLEVLIIIICFVSHYGLLSRFTSDPFRQLVWNEQ